MHTTVVVPAADCTLFFVAAAFNALVTIVLAIPDTPAWGLLGIAPPQPPLILHLFLVMPAVFALAYFWMGMNLVGKRPLLLISIIGKLSVFAVVIAHYLTGHIPAGLPALASGDLVFALLFVRVYRRQASS